MWRILKRYLANCNLHGARYLVEDGRHWSERLFWLVSFALSWWGCTTMVLGVLKDFNERPVAFTIETTFLDWQNKFPSISICYIALEASKDKFKKKFKFAPNLSNHLTLLQDMGIPNSMSPKYKNFTSEDLIYIYESAKESCTRLFAYCEWNGVEFDCCDEFLPLQTTVGYCYFINSQLTTDIASSMDFISNQSTGPGSLYVGLTDVAYTGASIGKKHLEAYFHNDLEVPSFSSNSDKHIEMRPGEIINVGFNVQDTFNDVGVETVSPYRRNCRFAHETDGTIYKWYSYDVCFTQVQVEHMLMLCGCVVHTYPRLDSMPVCNYTQLACVQKKKSIFGEKKNWLDRFQSRCLPDCEGNAMSYFSNDNYRERLRPVNDSKRKFPGLQIEMYSLPSVRYRRYVVHSPLDVVVAVGSAAGLFIGASVLSVVEIPYWLLLRHG